MFDPLILDPAPEKLWVVFQAEPRALEGRPGIVPHWRRALDLGASPAGPSPEDALERGGPLRSRIERLDPLLAAGQDVLHRVAAIADQNDYSLLVADADGVVVQALAGGGFRDEAQRNRLIEGAHWSERQRGTNAIGTALSEQRPVFVRGSAHFARSYHDLVCYAAPVRAPDGTVVAVLDATSRFACDERSMGFGVVAAAHALEEVLRVRSYENAGAQVMRTLARTLDHLDAPAILVEPPGRIARSNGAARAMLGAAGSRAALHALLGVDFAGLLALAGREGVDLRLGRRDVRLQVEPIESEGRYIAALVLLHARGAHAAPAAVARPPQAKPSSAAFGDLFAEDLPTRRAIAFAARVAASDLPIMLLAETGAGKELLAHGVHRASGRGDQPFVGVNCGAIQPSLLESELFGYGGGAFTGADRRGRDGYLAAAGHGTLFLDEVAEMPLAMQAALLRVLDTGAFRRVGETQLRPAACRIVCATCGDLAAMVQRGEFRRDLYYRLKGAIVTLPPLRDRSDMLPLARHILAQLCDARGVATPRLAPDFERGLEESPWPGNVRELKTTLEVALVLADGASRLTLEHLLDRGVPLAADAGEEPLADTEARAVRRALDGADGNISRAAQSLGVARSTLYRMLRKHGLMPPRVR